MKEAVYEVVCPHCHKRNKLYVMLEEEGFDEPEEFHCDYCGLEIGQIAAARPPRTECIDRDDD